MKSKKNLFAAVLSLLLIFTFVPVGAAFAAEAESDAELYRFSIGMLSDYDIQVWFDGERAADPTYNSSTYYIPEGTIIDLRYDGCYIIRESGLKFIGNDKYEMGAGEAYIGFSHR